MKQSTAEVVAHVNSTHGTSYQLVRRLAGGMQSGAFELSDGSSKVVLKWSEDSGWAHRVFRAAELVTKARAAGYPTPAWLAVGTTPAGSPYQLQDYVDGTPLSDATSLDLDLSEQLVRISECQRGLVDDGRSSWSDYVRGVVFEGWDGTWEEVRALDARSTELIARFERVCHPYRDQEIPIDDFVHGDLNVGNIIVADGVIAAVIDIEAASGGTRAYDLVTLAASAARDGAPAGVDEFFLEAALRWRPSRHRHLRSRQLCQHCGLRRHQDRRAQAVAQTHSFPDLPGPTGRGAAAAPAGSSMMPATPTRFSRASAATSPRSEFSPPRPPASGTAWCRSVTPGTATPSSASPYATSSSPRLRPSRRTTLCCR